MRHSDWLADERFYRPASEILYRPRRPGFRNEDFIAPAAVLRTTFSAACLAGANFSAAALGDVILTGAQLSAADGTIAVSHRFRSKGRNFRYGRTRLAPDTTGTDTTSLDAIAAGVRPNA